MVLFSVRTYMWLQHQYMWLQLQYMWLQHQYMWLQLAAQHHIDFVLYSEEQQQPTMDFENGVIVKIYKS